MAASKSTLRCFILNKRNSNGCFDQPTIVQSFPSPRNRREFFFFFLAFFPFAGRQCEEDRIGGRGRRKYPRVTRTNGTGLSGNIKFTISGAFQYRGFACSCLTRQSHDYPHGTWGVKGEILSLSLTRGPSSFLPCNALFCIGNGP